MSRTPVFPISLYLRDRKVIVVGDGRDANRRAEGLAAVGAIVRQISASDLAGALREGAFLVFAQSGDVEVDRVAARTARSSGALAYAHDLPDESDFAMPAVAARGPLKISVSTDGVAPALSRRVRAELDRLLAQAGDAIDALLERLQEVRSQVADSERSARLGGLASRLQIRGQIDVAPDDSA
jgi:siroheme synthase (precorrin-2 oxidase/ferrochelatase)